MAPTLDHVTEFRVRYSEVDRLGTYYNSRALEWFECGRVELLRALGRPYDQMERDGAMLPLTEAHVHYAGPATFDEPLRMHCEMRREGKARLRFEMRVEHAETGRVICEGYTVHAVTNPAGKPVKPPAWLIELFKENG